MLMRTLSSKGSIRLSQASIEDFKITSEIALMVAGTRPGID